MTTDPLVIVWDALERAGCEPHGQPWDFYARCPVHNGESNEALHVSVGADGRALLWCFAHTCSAQSIAAALDVEVCDLFPPGHHRARRRSLPEAQRGDFTGSARAVVNILAAVEKLHAEWYLELRTDCAHCGSPAALAHASSSGAVSLSCPGDADAEALGYTGCTLDQFRQALAARVRDCETDS